MTAARRVLPPRAGAWWASRRRPRRRWRAPSRPQAPRCRGRPPPPAASGPAAAAARRRAAAALPSRPGGSPQARALPRPSGATRPGPCGGEAGTLLARGQHDFWVVFGWPAQATVCVRGRRGGGGGPFAAAVAASEHDGAVALQVGHGVVDLFPPAAEHRRVGPVAEVLRVPAPRVTCGASSALTQHAHGLHTFWLAAYIQMVLFRRRQVREQVLRRHGGAAFQLCEPRQPRPAGDATVRWYRSVANAAAEMATHPFAVRAAQTAGECCRRGPPQRGPGSCAATAARASRTLPRSSAMQAEEE